MRLVIMHTRKEQLKTGAQLHCRTGHRSNVQLVRGQCLDAKSGYERWQSVVEVTILSARYRLRAHEAGNRTTQLHTPIIFIMYLPPQAVNMSHQSRYQESSTLAVRLIGIVGVVLSN